MFCDKKLVRFIGKGFNIFSGCLSNNFPMRPMNKPSSQQAARWLRQRAKTARLWVGLSVGLGFVSGVLLIAQARLLAHIVASVFIKDVSREALWFFFAAFALVVAVRAGLAWARQVAGFVAGARVREQTRMALMEQLFALGPGYAAGLQSGAASSILLEHVEGLHDFFALYLPQLALAVMIPAAIAAFVFPVSWAAGGILLVTAPLIPLFMVLVGMGAENISQRHYKALGRMSAHFLDVLQGLATLKLFGRSRDEEKNVARVSGEYRRRTMSVLRVAFLSSAVLEFFSSMAIALVAVYLGMTYLGYFDFGSYGQPLTLAGGFFILLLAPEFYLPLRELGAHYHARAAAIGAGEEILRILAAPVPESGRDPKILDKPASIHIQGQDLHLAYENGKRPALRGVDFEIAAGHRVVVVGASGAGKTTLLNLLLGFLQPDRGQLLINNTPLSRIAPDSWRQHITWIGHNPILFQGTIRENICLARPEAGDGEVEQAARAARVLDFCKQLPRGLDTPVGEQGLGLSRGQAQRVALARAFLKNAPLLLLDEPTADLDTHNERLVIQALEDLSRGKTVLMLAHRLAGIERADRILVLADGRIVEQGSYQQLIAAGGEFFRLVSSNMKATADG